MIEDQLRDLGTLRAKENAPTPIVTNLSNGSVLVEIPDVEIGAGWAVRAVKVLFLVPPGFPAAQPDCFWVEPTGLRLANGGTPQNSNDSNPIPGDSMPDRRTTWFSWHLQGWNPNRDSLQSYFHVIMKRMVPAR